MSTLGLRQDGPYGGMGGSAYDARKGEQKVRHLDAWTTNYNGYEVIGALEFEFENGEKSGRIGGKDNNMNYYGPKPYDFASDETIKDMWIYAGDDEGYVNGFNFTTDRGNFDVGGHEGLPTHLGSQDLGNGEWAGATGRDDIHGADAVVDNMILYFRL